MVIFRTFTNTAHTRWLLEVNSKQYAQYARKDNTAYFIKDKFVYLDEYNAVDFLTELRQRGIEFDTRMVEL